MFAGDLCFHWFRYTRALKSNTGDAVAHELWQLIALFGLPKVIQSDNGAEFNNSVVRALVKLLGNEHRFISPYNARCDGKVERAIGTVMSIIKKLLHGTEKLWYLFISFAQLCYNSR